MSQRTHPRTTAGILRRAWSPGDPRSIYHEVSRLGFGPAEAGNLTAYLVGIPPVVGGWSPRELERLLFVHHLVERGWPDARVRS